VADDPWVDDASAALLTDQYQLTMVQAYWREEMFETAVFSLFVRRLPEGWNYLLACGLDDALRYLERVRFDEDALAYLATLDGFSADFLGWLRDFRFTGSVDALPEGTPFFAEEPILVVEAPLPEAQLVETFLMNQVHLQTLLASKGARVVTAAQGRTVVDFGLRRTHGTDAGMKGARAFWIAGVDGTSNVLAGRAYGIPLNGTMAHSYVQAHDDERDAFRAFSALYPGTVLLVDTYDTLEGVRHVAELADQLGPDFAVRGIRLDSGDLAALARDARHILDDAGLGSVGIIASGGLDEYEVARLVRAGAPIDGFGVGTAMAVSKDAPSLDTAYKLTSYAGRGRLKLSPGKEILPGHNQVWRQDRDGRAVRDVIAPATPRGDVPHGRALLRRVMEHGARVEAGREGLDTIRLRVRAETDRLPSAIRSLEPAHPPYPVVVGDELRQRQQRLAERLKPGSAS
jgi:nicotinate phosphoribosyltransferase